MPYLFSPVASLPQNEIWQYTYGKWAEKLANDYISGLHDTIREN